MLGFILGSMFGGTVGVFTMCLCTAASRADEELNSMHNRTYKDIK